MPNIETEVVRQLLESCTTLARDLNSLRTFLGCTERLLAEAKARSSQNEEDILETFKSTALTVCSLATNDLALSRLEDEGLSLTQEPLVLNGILRRVTRPYATEARYRRIALALCLQQGLPLVHGNRLALEWVFADLVREALQCTAARGLVTVSSTLQDGAVVVMITDTGRGSVSEEVPFVCEHYWRAEHVREQQRIEGRLAGVKRVVAACGGRVQAENRFGQETCVSVFLPVPPEALVIH